MFYMHLAVDLVSQVNWEPVGVDRVVPALKRQCCRSKNN